MGLGVNKRSNDSLCPSKAVCRLFDVQRDEKTEGGWFWSRIVPRNCQMRYHNFRLRSVMKVVCCAHLHSHFTLCTRISLDFIRAEAVGTISHLSSRVWDTWRTFPYFTVPVPWTALLCMLLHCAGCHDSYPASFRITHVQCCFQLYDHISTFCGITLHSAVSATACCSRRPVSLQFAGIHF